MILLRRSRSWVAAGPAASRCRGWSSRRDERLGVAARGTARRAPASGRGTPRRRTSRGARWRRVARPGSPRASRAASRRSSGWYAGDGGEVALPLEDLVAAGPGGRGTPSGAICPTSSRWSWWASAVLGREHEAAGAGLAAARDDRVLGHVAVRGHAAVGQVEHGEAQIGVGTHASAARRAPRPPAACPRRSGPRRRRAGPGRAAASSRSVPPTPIARSSQCAARSATRAIGPVARSEHQPALGDDGGGPGSGSVPHRPRGACRCRRRGPARRVP